MRSGHWWMRSGSPHLQSPCIARSPTRKNAVPGARPPGAHGLGLGRVTVAFDTRRSTPLRRSPAELYYSPPASYPRHLPLHGAPPAPTEASQVKGLTSWASPPRGVTTVRTWSAHMRRRSRLARGSLERVPSDCKLHLPERPP